MKHYVGVQLRSRLTSFLEALEAAQQNAADPDHLHDLRVASRRFSQALRLFRDFLKKKDVKRMRARIHDIVHTCGSVRDCDVTLATLAAADVHEPELVAEIEQQRQERLEQLKQSLADGVPEPAAWRHQLEPRSPNGATWFPDQTAAASSARVLPVMAAELFRAGAAAVASGESDKLHRFRLLGKRFRYSLELFSDVDGATLEQMKALQDGLGAINDCAAAIPYAEGHPDAQQRLQVLLAHRRAEFLDFWKHFGTLERKWVRLLGG
jgi:CHAD domain-containing protein